MNTRQKLHQIKLQEWLEHFQNQAASSLTVKDWCSQNNISIHTYNYWKHQLKEEYVQSALPDIVPLSASQSPSNTESIPKTQTLITAPCISYNSLESRDSLNTNSIYITCGDIQLSVNASISDERLLRILKAVRYA